MYSYTLWHFCRLFVCRIVVLCVIHNSVGSALLVLTVDGHTRASMRGTSDSTVPALFLCYLNAGCGTAGVRLRYEEIFIVAYYGFCIVFGRM